MSPLLNPTTNTGRSHTVFFVATPAMVVHHTDNHANNNTNVNRYMSGHQQNGHNNYSNNTYHASTNNEGTTIRAEAVLVPFVEVAIDAEIAESQSQLDRNVFRQHHRGGNERSIKFWFMNMFALILFGVVVGAVTGVVVICGTGNCDRSSSSPLSPSVSTNDEPNTPTIDLRPVPTTTSPPTYNPSRSPTVIPTIAPIRETPTTDTPTTTHPIVVPVTDASIPSPASMDQQLMVACNFLSFTNLTICQARTLYDTVFGGDVTVGNSIPNEIGLLTQLTNLILDDEELIGTIPSTVGNLVHLSLLSVSRNQFTGTIPSTFGDLIQLTILYLDSNQLIGTIPSSLGNLIQLSILELDGNQLNGTIPSAMGNLSQLNYLTLFNNTQLVGTIPSTLCATSSENEILIDCENIACSCCQSSDVTGVTVDCPI